MNLPFHIARRYLFSKKSNNAINIISMVSVCGVAIATMAMVCALSVFNGFSDMVAVMFSYFDPELKITPKTGKVFNPLHPGIQEIRNMSEIIHFSEVIEDNALVRYKDKQDFAIIKGVDKGFGEQIHIDSILIDGRFALREDIVDYATLGIGLASTLGVRANYSSPLEIFAPKRNESVNMANPASSFDTEYAYIGGVFHVNQNVYDENYMIVPIELTRSLFRYDTEISAIELQITPGSSLSSVKKKIKELIGDEFHVQDRYEQQADSFKMMQIEKWITFLILCFILAIALFNLVGSLSMLMIEKQEDIQTLRNMGACNTFIRRIFLFEGWIITGLGTIIGTSLGLFISLLQQKFGFIQLGQASGAFVIDAYPVRIILSDIITVIITVMLMGGFAAWYAVRYLGKQWLIKK